MDAEQRFWMKVDVRADNECWHWTGALDRTGYGRFYDGKRVVAAHRFSYELNVGPIPPGFDGDHTCHNADASCPGGACNHRRCVNPSHISPCSRKDNLARSSVVANAREAYWAKQRAKTHCPRGHVYDDANTYTNAKGQRSCIACRNLRGSSDYRRAVEAGGKPPKNPKTHCKRGHELTPENTLIDPRSGKRRCRTCANDRQRIAYHRRKLINTEA